MTITRQQVFSEIARGVALLVLSAFLGPWIGSYVNRERLHIEHVRVVVHRGNIALPRDELDALVKTQSWMRFSAREPDSSRSLANTATSLSPAEFQALRARIDEFQGYVYRQARGDSAILVLADKIVAWPSKEADAFLSLLGKRHPDLAVRKLQGQPVENLVTPTIEAELIDLDLSHRAAGRVGLAMERRSGSPVPGFDVIATILNRGETGGAVVEDATLELSRAGVAVQLLEPEADPSRGRVPGHSFERVKYSCLLGMQPANAASALHAALVSSTPQPVLLKLTTVRGETLSTVIDLPRSEATDLP